jgi:hypothetical protein
VSVDTFVSCRMLTIPNKSNPRFAARIANSALFLVKIKRIIYAQHCKYPYLSRLEDRLEGPNAPPTVDKRNNPHFLEISACNF